MSSVVGVDSGGTKTIFAACDRAANLTAFRQTASLAPTPTTDWVPHFDALCAREAKSLLGAEFHLLGLPFHGEDPAYSAHQSAIIQQRLGARALVENDVRIAFDGAFAGTAGVLILGGTGSMAWGSLNTAKAAHFRVGGWGDMIGDEGSAFWIGRQALIAVARHLDGREESPAFCNFILSHLSLSPDGFHAWINANLHPRQAYAALAIPVSNLAQNGNATAQNILAKAADQLAMQAQTIWRKTHTDAPLNWSYAGGVFNSAYLLKQLQERLQCAPVPPRLPPIGGALLRAAQSAGWSPTQDWITKLAAALDEKLTAKNTN